MAETFSYCNIVIYGRVPSSKRAMYELTSVLDILTD